MVQCIKLVFGDDGEFDGDDAMVGDDSNKANAIVFNELNEHDANEGDDGDVKE